MPTSEAVTNHSRSARQTCLVFEDLYDGKLHAALDRRHPRDLFDAMLLYDNEGPIDDLFRVFMDHVASSANRCTIQRRSVPHFSQR